MQPKFNLDNLEEELKDLRPARLDPALVRRIGSAVVAAEAAGKNIPFPREDPLPTSAPRNPRAALPLWPFAAAACAVIVLGAVSFIRHTPVDTTPVLPVGGPEWVATETTSPDAEPHNSPQVDPGARVFLAEITRQQRAQKRYKPVSVENAIVDLREDGLIYTGDNTPARQVRYQLVDSITWMNGDDGSSIRIETPREAVVTIPLEIY